MKIDLKTQTSGQLVDALVQLDKLRLQTARSIDMYKAELQARGVSIMDDRNQQYIRFYGDGGSASITDNCKANETYQFTLTKPVPAGGLLAGFYGMPDQAPTAWKVYSFADGNSAAIETVSVTAGSGGTNLGTFLPAGDGKVNSLHRLAYGYNRWSQSALRQWLNSDAAAGEWWASQNDYDRAPDQLSQKDGFLKGFEADFLECIQPVKVVTALNTVTDKADGETEVTYDMFFPLSLEEMYIEPQLAGEGEACPYWKHASGLAAKMKQYQTYPQIRTFAIENHVSPQGVRLRSAYRGYAGDTWSVYASGGVYNYYAVGASRCAPACAIC